jgi:hypothetical protein
MLRVLLPPTQPERRMRRARTRPPPSAADGEPTGDARGQLLLLRLMLF